jgi:glycine oxidase
LFKRDHPFLIIDREDEFTSSKVAAGLINPITGRYLTKSWRVEETLPIAFAFYREIEALTDSSFFHELPIVRLFKSDDESKRWQKRRKNPAYSPYYHKDTSTWLDSDAVEHSQGGFVTRNSGYLDLNTFLRVSRQFFKELGCYQRADSWDEFDARTTIFSQGFEAATNPLFDWIPFKSAKGEILSLQIEAPELPRDRIYNRGVWLLPTADGKFRTGSTYSWDPLDCRTTDEARESITGRLGEWLKVPFEVVAHEAGVRPIINASKVLIGRHPARDEIAFFNGLGSKGVSNAPFFADQLVEHLCGNGLIDAEVDLRKNL